MIYLYDQNHISLAGGTDLIFTEDVAKRFEAYGWHTRSVPDGNDTEDIATAIEEAQAEDRRPSLILVRTHIGYGSPKKQDNFSAHGNPLGEEELQATKKALGWPTMDKFYLPERCAWSISARPSTRAPRRKRTGRRSSTPTRKDFRAKPPSSSRSSAASFPRTGPRICRSGSPADKPIATRVAGGEALNALAKHIPNIIGGSADLNPSTNTALKGMGDFQPSEFAGPGTLGAVGGEWGYAGRNIAFGVREHAMGAAVNGMAAHGGVLPFSATFLVFSDYMKPAIRLGALSGLESFYVFTHDSIGVGEDGPTHEPVEQLAGLRAIPGLTVIRPADANETAEAWAFAVQHNGPTLFALTRQNIPHLDRSNAKDPGVAKGAYIMSEAEGGAAGSDSDRHRLRSRAMRESAGEAEGIWRKSARGQHAELESVRGAGRGVSRKCAAESGQEARNYRSRLAVRLAAMGRRRRNHHRHRSLRRFRARGRSYEAFRFHRRTCYVRGVAASGAQR